ncbi:unnamed protein product, partial [Larinioides sclopetarius]
IYLGLKTITDRVVNKCFSSWFGHLTWSSCNLWSWCPDAQTVQNLAARVILEYKAALHLFSTLCNIEYLCYSWPAGKSFHSKLLFGKQFNSRIKCLSERNINSPTTLL